MAFKMITKSEKTAGKVAGVLELLQRAFGAGRSKAAPVIEALEGCARIQ